MSGTRAPPNVLLVVLDSVRAKNTSLLGHKRETTPFLERFADRATTYTRGYAPSTESLASHASLFSGLPVRAHGLTTSTGVTMTPRPDEEKFQLRPESTIWRELSEAGYATAVFSNNPFLTELPTGLPASFKTVVGRQHELPVPDALDPRSSTAGDSTGNGSVEKYISFLRDVATDSDPIGSLKNGVAFKLGQRLSGLPTVDSSARTYVDAFLEWQANRPEPWAACLNLMDAHQPYQAGPAPQWSSGALLDRLREPDDPVWEYVGGNRPLEELRSFERAYDDAIRSIDAQLRRLVETLADRDELDRSLVVVTADHGEGFGEVSAVRPGRRVVGHSSGSVHDALTHVPLVVKRPGQQTGRTVDRPASLTEFADAVRRIRDDTATEDTQLFVPTGEVVASTDGINEHMAELAAKYTDQEDIDVRLQPADAVYEATGGDIVKHVTWGDRSGTVQRDGSDRSVKRGGDAGRRVSAALESSERADILTRRRSDISEDVTSHLEELGYL